MAAATTHEEPIVPISEMPRSRAAQEKLVTIRQERLKVGETLARYRSALDPNIAMHQHPMPEQIWDARVHIEETERRFAQLSLEEAAARTNADAAREADSETLRAQFVALKRAALKAIIPALRTAEREMLALQRLENREQELLGAVDRVAWTSLTQNDAGEHALDDWIAYVRTLGLVE